MKLILELNCLLNNQESKEGKNDLDNFLKPIIDTLDESDTLNSESQICSIYIKRNKVHDKSEEGVIIELESKKVI